MSFNYQRWKESQFRPSFQAPTNQLQPFPRSIMCAAIIWAVVGTLHFGLVVLRYFQAKTFQEAGAIVPGVWFIAVAIRVASGSVSKTTLYGVVSLFFGLVWGSIANTVMHRFTGTFFVLMGLLAYAMAGALLVAGFLAVVGESNYEKWRGNKSP